MHSQFTLTLNFPFVCSMILHLVFTKNSFSSKLSTWLQTFLLAKPNAYFTFSPTTRWSQLHFSTVNKTSIHYSKIRLHSHFILLTCTLHHYYHECCNAKQFPSTAVHLKWSRYAITLILYQPQSRASYTDTASRAHSKYWRVIELPSFCTHSPGLWRRWHI